MVRLILLNGPPGCGKSTLAGMYVQEHPLALKLDIDRVRDLLGQWKERPDEAGPVARELALAMARAHLSTGRDVIVPQYLGRLHFIEQLEQLAAEVGARFDEIVLLDSKEASLSRFRQRSEAAADPAHVEAQEMIDLAGGTAELADMYERLKTVLAVRPSARIVRTTRGQVERAYRDFVARLA